MVLQLLGSTNNPNHADREKVDKGYSANSLYYIRTDTYNVSPSQVINRLDRLLEFYWKCWSYCFPKISNPIWR